MESRLTELTSLSRVLSEYLATYPLTIFSILCLVVVAYTRLTSGRLSRSIDGETKVPSVVPHWIPYVGHAAWFIVFTDKLKQVRFVYSLSF